MYAAAGSQRTAITTLTRPVLRALGVFNRNVRELRHTYYQFAAPFVVDDSAFRDAFGGHTTGWDEIITATLAWYRNQAATTHHSADPAAFPTLKVSP